MMLQVFSSETSFSELLRLIKLQLSHTPAVTVGEWQSQTVSHPLQQFHELHNVIADIAIRTADPNALEKMIEPNMPWAEEHFQERISGHPHNPPPSHINWPFAASENRDHTNTWGEFSHTYPERFWPKKAGYRAQTLGYPNQGIRYPYGDLDDVVSLLARTPLTRQAYLPVWFPEDTGNNSHERVPCTLGYHFQIRDTFRYQEQELQLNCTYAIRSCDLYRHFNDDVYMAARLMQFVTQQVNYLANLEVNVGNLIMHVMNLHCFAGDMPRLKMEINHEN